ncbi:MAG: hypothetical protein WEB67_12785, partial [Acidimicrobiia bacterium]
STRPSSGRAMCRWLFSPTCRTGSRDVSAAKGGSGQPDLFSVVGARFSRCGVGETGPGVMDSALQFVIVFQLGLFFRRFEK